MPKFFRYSSANGVDMQGIPMDENGMRIDLLEKKISELKAKGIKPKFIYTIPNYQNPAGYTMSQKPDESKQENDLRISYGAGA